MALEALGEHAPDRIEVAGQVCPAGTRGIASKLSDTRDG